MGEVESRAVKAHDMSKDTKQLSLQASSADSNDVDLRVSQILMDYPTQPDWSAESAEVLIQLVFDQECEPFFAEKALDELSMRNHPAVGDLCVFLLKEQAAYSVLKAQAIALLPHSHMEQGLDELLDLFHWCDAEMLGSLVEAARLVMLKDLPLHVRNHPVLGIVSSLTKHKDAVYFSGSLNKETFVEASKLAMPNRISWRKFMLTLGGWAIASAFLAGLGTLETPAVMVLMLGFVLIWLGWQLEREHDVLWERNPECGAHVFGVIGAEGIEVHGENFARFTPWNRLAHWNISSKNILVVVSQIEARAFPAVFFATPADHERARALCAVHLQAMPNLKPQ